MSRWVLVLCLPVTFAAGVLVSACGGNNSDPDAFPTGSFNATATPFHLPDRSPTQHELPIRIAVTLPLFEEFARLAGADYVEVISLIPPGENPHKYSFTDADIERMKGIDFFFLNGLGLDSRLQDVIETSRDEDARVIPFASNILSPSADGLTAQQVGDNSHLWLDPSLAYVYVEIIADELVIYDGIHETDYNANFTKFKERMLEFQDDVYAMLQEVPAEHRKLISYHDSLVHLARRFDATAAGYVVEAAGEVPAQDDLAHLERSVREQGIPAVFSEFGYDVTTMDQLASRSGVPMCTLYSDVVPADLSYEEMMRANAEEIVRCLGG